MIEKVRDIIEELTALGDAVKGDDIQTRLKTTRDDAVRALKDRKELFVDGQAIIKFGKHRFSVNEQELELSIVPREGEMCFHLSGTNFFEPVRDKDFLATESVWDQEVISETREVYRAEWLAYQFLEKGGAETLEQFMQPRYNEGYLKGVHDLDAAKIIAVLQPMKESAGLLHASPRTRAKALLGWDGLDEEIRSELSIRLRAHGEKKKAFGESEFTDIQRDAFIVEMEDHFTEEQAEYLFDEISNGPDFVVSKEAADLTEKLKSELTSKRAKKAFEAALAEFQDSLEGRFAVAADWLGTFSNNEEVILESKKG